MSPVEGRRLGFGLVVLLLSATVWLLAHAVLTPGRLLDFDGLEKGSPTRASGTQRHIRGRLAGVAYLPYRGVTRQEGPPGTPNPDLVRVAAELQLNAEHAPTPDALHALGVALVLVSDFDGGIAALESAAADEPLPDYLADLSASYLARYDVRATAEDIPKALTAATEALFLQPDRPEALFNKALALQHLGLRDLATRAWADYVGHGPADGWSQEARQYLEAQRTARRQESEGAFDPDRWLLSDDAAHLETALRAGDSGSTVHILDLLRRYSARGPDRFAYGFADDLGALVARDATEAYAVVSALRAAAISFQNDGFGDAASSARGVFDSYLATHPSVSVAASQYVLTDAFFQGHVDWVTGRTAELLALARRLDYLRAEAQFLTRLGTMRFSKGEYGVARDLELEAIRVWARLGDPVGAAVTRIQLAESYRVLGEDGLAWREYVAALQHLEWLPSRSRRHTLLTSSAVCALNEQAFAVAEAFATAAREQAASLKAYGFLTESYYLLARTQSGLGLHAKAQDLLDSARRSFAEVKDSGLRTRLEAELTFTEAQVSLTNDASQAVRAADTSLQVFRRLHAHHRDVQLLSLKGEALVQLGDLPSAERALDLAVSVAEGQARTVSRQSSKLTFIDDIWTPFAQMVGLQLLMNRPGVALAYVDRGLAMQAARALPAQFGTFSRHPTVVYYSSPTMLFAWFVHPDGTFNLRQVPCDASDLKRAVERLNVKIRSGVAESELSAEIEAVSRIVVWPMASLLAGVSALAVVPDPIIQRVPFALLTLAPTDGRPLVEHLNVTLCQSLSACVVLPSRGLAPVSAIALYASGAIGDAPRLPAVEGEAAAVAAAHRSGVAVPATLASLRHALETADTVHYAGHAFLNSSRPWLSELALNDRGATTRTPLSEVLPPRVRSRVVVLGACSTVGGTALRGQGVVGIAAEVLSRGASDVVATLWDVDDSSMSIAAPVLHRAIAAGEPTAEAVRTAQLVARLAGTAPRDWAFLVTVSGGGAAPTPRALSPWRPR